MGTEEEVSRKGGLWERRGANVAVSTDNGGEAGERGSLAEGFCFRP